MSPRRPFEARSIVQRRTVADDRLIRNELRVKTGWSTQNLSNRVTSLIDKQLMSRIHALYVLAHREGINLERFGVDDATLIQVGELSLGVSAPEQQATTRLREPVGSDSNSGAGQTAASRFALRDLHQNVVRASRKSFNNGLPQEAVHKSFQSVNNRVKRLTGTARDGFDLMGWAFNDSPQLQMTGRSTESEENEHAGLRFLMQGSMRGIRNPRVHEDHWEPDGDETPVLELLSFASYLHRCLDRCEMYRAIGD